MSRSCTWFVVVTCLLAGLTPPAAIARDVFVTVGGGPDPANNQVSLEKNVEYFSQVVANHYPSPRDQRNLFADGTASAPDLQFIDEAVQPSQAMRWMCRIIGNEYGIAQRYRNHELSIPAAPADKQHVQELIQQLADELGRGDRLILYVTAHGGPGGSKDRADSMDVLNWDDALLLDDWASASPPEHARDTSIILWGDEELRASEFTDWLDQFSPEVEVVVVMVQCYSGGFAEFVFREANRRYGLSDRPRCGFFSQRHDRASAGCTPAVDEANYQEYSSYFWAALDGRSRHATEPIQADYDHNGRVSLAEAHAYAVITCDTIDIPLRTSDVVLRKYSKFASEPAAMDPADVDQPGLVESMFGGLLGRSEPSDLAAKPYSLERTIDDLLPLARPDQKEIITQLASRLELTHDLSVRQISRQRKTLAQKLNKKYAAQADLSDSETTLIDEIRRSLHRANPEFHEHGFSPIITDWTSTRSDEFVQLIESFEESRSLLHVQSRIESLASEVDELERREAKLQRLLLTLQNVLLEVNLTHVADEPTCERVRQLIARENSTLWP